RGLQVLEVRRHPHAEAHDSLTQHALLPGRARRHRHARLSRPRRVRGGHGRRLPRGDRRSLRRRLPLPPAGRREPPLPLRPAAAPRPKARARRARPRHQQGGRARGHGRSEAPTGRGREVHRHGPARHQPAVRLLVDGRGQRAHDRGAEGQARALRVGRPRGLGRALVRITTEGTASDGVEEPTMPLVKLAGSMLVLGLAALAAGCIAVPVGPPVAVAPPPVVIAPAPVVVAPRPYVVAPAYPVYGYYRPYGYGRRW